jgi:glycosyltransferase involved in cell wall biosynthesis
MPENGIALSDISKRKTRGEGQLSLCFAGRLVPYKGCDLVLKALGALIAKDMNPSLPKLQLDIYGDGPEKHKLFNLARSLNICSYVRFHGSVSRDDVLQGLRKADLLLFPSRREFGGGVVLEAMACGASPVILAHGGPDEITNHDNAFKIYETHPKNIISKMVEILSLCRSQSKSLGLKQENAIASSKAFTWSSKANIISQHYQFLESMCCSCKY